MSGTYSDTLRNIKGIDGVKHYLEHPENHYIPIARHIEWCHEAIIELLARIEALESKNTVNAVTVKTGTEDADKVGEAVPSESEDDQEVVTLGLTQTYMPEK